MDDAPSVMGEARGDRHTETGDRSRPVYFVTVTGSERWNATSDSDGITTSLFPV